MAIKADKPHLWKADTRASVDLVSGGRVYGGGLHKVEPNELAQISAREVLDSIDGQLRIERQEKLFA